MSDKLILFILLTGFFHLPTIFSEEISNEEMTNAIQCFFRKHYEECKHTISEESYQILLDGSEDDNEETRAYILCTFEALKWLVNKKFDPQAVLKTLPSMTGKEFTTSESNAAESAMEICKKEAEMYTTEIEKMLNFLLCFKDRMQFNI